ncbi:hypothetical protein PHISCL_07975 [Aspergillus sclerotialis]|uniref:Chromatin assembly factor 1 subunit Cac1-like C-terminal domain-containing protein n=1 Tax=Aspergillus sclerotialis TaxID=2070753 RepID=A0A3A2ZEC8_9EURO|nr:hypothetical protein PHISCL_07975 [Aspergillus sclerotialis]
MYRIATISDSVTFPIDPFSTAYWQKPKAETGPFSFGNKSTTGGSSQFPPPPDGGVQGKPKRMLPTEHLEEFKQVVDGSDLSKMGLVEVLKKRFPKVSKEVLRGTLDSVAERVGQKEADKKWVCR